jgi:hypothetical protein
MIAAKNGVPASSTVIMGATEEKSLIPIKLG